MFQIVGKYSHGRHTVLAVETEVTSATILLQDGVTTGMATLNYHALDRGMASSRAEKMVENFERYRSRFVPEAVERTKVEVNISNTLCAEALSLAAKFPAAAGLPLGACTVHEQDLEGCGPMTTVIMADTQRNKVLIDLDHVRQAIAKLFLPQASSQERDNILLGVLNDDAGLIGVGEIEFLMPKVLAHERVVVCPW